MIKVMVCGGFDPIHSGHLEHIRLAKELGDYLVVAVNPDIDMIRKKSYCFLPLKERLEIVKSLKWVDEVIEVIDTDGTCVRTLESVSPDIFAKGGDRTPSNMPANEIEVCMKLGIRITYGVGRRLNSSSDVVKRFLIRYTGEEVKN
jgi:cytidyltransferase-like protein